MANKLYLAIIFALLLGCQSDWDKNPRVEGLPPEVEQEPPTYMAAMRDSIFIMSNHKYEFVEGQDATVEFEVKVLQEDISDFQVEIPGLEDYLTGATQSFDPATGKLTIKWKVPEVFVRGVDNKEVSYDLEVKAYTKSLNGSTSGRDQPITFTVMRRLERPEILSVEWRTGTGVPTLKEGSTLTLKVKVRDPNASNGRVTVAPPVLIAEPTGAPTRKSGHHLISFDPPSQDPNDPQIWDFDLDIVTTNLEITNNSTTFHYDLRAYTPMGMSDEKLRSQVFSGTFKVVTSLGQVAFTGGRAVTFREGGANSLTVAFYDPKGESKAIVDKDALAKTCSEKGATCECNTDGDNQICEIWWSPKSSDADPRRVVAHEFKFSAYLQHKSTSETSPAKEFKQTINVSAAF